jgi:hypothetical protein
MTTPESAVRPLDPDQSLHLRQAAAQALEVLQGFSGDQIRFGATALQVLDEWVERVQRNGALPPSAQVLVIAFLGHTFLQTYGGYWVMRVEGEPKGLGVVCPVTASDGSTRFIDIVDAVKRRLDHGIHESLALFYLATSLDLKKQTVLNKGL